MRRIAGSFLILAAFSGCAEDRLAQGDWAPGTRMGRTTVAGSSWPRDDVAQLPAGQGSDMSGSRMGGTGVVIGPQGPAPAYQGAVQTAAKPPAPFPAGYPATGAADARGPGTGGTAERRRPGVPQRPRRRPGARQWRRGRRRGGPQADARRGVFGRARVRHADSGADARGRHGPEADAGLRGHRLARLGC